MTAEDGVFVGRQILDLDISPSEKLALAVIQRRPAISRANLAEALGLSKQPTMTMIGRLKSAGHLSEGVPDGYKRKQFRILLPQPEIEPTPERSAAERPTAGDQLSVIKNDADGIGSVGPVIDVEEIGSPESKEARAEAEKDAELMRLANEVDHCFTLVVELEEVVRLGVTQWSPAIIQEYCRRGLELLPMLPESVRARAKSECGFDHQHFFTHRNDSWYCVEKFVHELRKHVKNRMQRQKLVNKICKVISDASDEQLALMRQKIEAGQLVGCLRTDLELSGLCFGPENKGILSTRQVRALTFGKKQGNPPSVLEYARANAGAIHTFIL